MSFLVTAKKHALSFVGRWNVRAVAAASGTRHASRLKIKRVGFIVAVEHAPEVRLRDRGSGKLAQMERDP